jgi:hypothetical protein
LGLISQTDDNLELQQGKKDELDCVCSELEKAVLNEEFKEKINMRDCSPLHDDWGAIANELERKHTSKYRHNFS